MRRQSHNSQRSQQHKTIGNKINNINAPSHAVVHFQLLGPFPEILKTLREQETIFRNIGIMNEFARGHITIYNKRSNFRY